MRAHPLLGKTFSCECGKTHRVPVRHLIYEPGAAERLPALLEAEFPHGAVAIIADRRTWTAAGQAVQHALEKGGRRVAAVTILPDPAGGEPVCDDRTKAWLETQVPVLADILLAVGSGVVNDLTKWLATDRGRPWLVCATAASMNGYTSATIAPAIGGIKRVVDGQAPFAVVADPAVLAAAPWRLTAAGLGDVLAKPVSMTDWRLNHLLFGDYYCPLCARLITEIEPTYRDHPEDLARRDPAAIEGLFQALLYSGLSMTLAGTSFPASGGEHMVSHVLDMKAMADGRPHDYHGRQVGLGTILAAALYERLLVLEQPRWAIRQDATDAAYWGPLTAVVEVEHAAKRRRAAEAVERLRTPGVWDSVRRLIAEAGFSAAAIKDCLRRAQAAHRLSDIGCSREDFVAALRHSHQIRARYTVLDLARAAGLWPDLAEELTDKWLSS